MPQDARPQAHKRRLETIARALCAHKMGLLDDAEGRNVPDELWRPFQERAEAVLYLIGGPRRG